MITHTRSKSGCTSPLPYVFGYLLVTFINSQLCLWYLHLWLPHHHLAYWTQVLPLALAISILGLLLSKGAGKYILMVPLTLLFVASVIAQTLVWTGILAHPFF